MQSASHEEREIRAARNQALFRAINEKLKELNELFVAASGTFLVACECADAECLEVVEIRPDEYRAVRAEPRRFVVLPDHVRADAEDVVAKSQAYVVVENRAAEAEPEDELASTTAS